MQRKTLTKFRCFFKELPGGLEFCIANTLREALLCTTLDKPILFLNLHDFQNFPSDSLELLFKTCWTCFSSVQFISVAQSWPTPRIAVHQASLSITISWSSLRLTSIESVMPSSHLILGHPLLLLLPIPPSIRVFSNESALRMRWPKYWSFSFSIIPSKEHPGPVS